MPITNAKIKFTLSWAHNDVQHSNEYIAEKVNLWRDFLPFGIEDEIKALQIGESYEHIFDTEALIPNFDSYLVRNVTAAQFVDDYQPSMLLQPKLGRWYPTDMFRDVSGFFKGNTYPSRVVEINNDMLRVDFNHPLAQQKVTFKATIIDQWDGDTERGGSSNDWADIICKRGPGLEALMDEPIDFTASNELVCMDTRDDSLFYAESEPADYIDQTSQTLMADINASIIHNGSTVLDLMCGQTTHISATDKHLNITGLGLNKKELSNNSSLSSTQIFDVNSTEALPFDDNSFDIVLCSLAVQYIRHLPHTLNEIKRILKTGGKIIFNYSEQDVMSKTLSIWKELHRFERLAYILQHLKQQGFKKLNSHTLTGMHRNDEDPGLDHRLEADEIFSAWATK